MDAAPQETPQSRPKRRISTPVLVVMLAALAAGGWYWYSSKAPVSGTGGGAVQIVSGAVATADVAVRFSASGQVTPLQTVDIYAQNAATIRTVHIKEGQFVKQGDKLFTLDTRTEDANLGRAQAQVEKDRADLANAERNLERQTALFKQEYISRAELDTAQNTVDGLRNQLAADQATLAASRVSRSFDDITAPIPGRTGAIAVYPGSLAQPGAQVLVNIAQIDPVNVAFTLPEQQFSEVHQAFLRGKVRVSAQPDASGQAPMEGYLTFVDNTVDSASGSIRLKAEFSNPDHRLWPGMFVTVTLDPSLLKDALTVPVQAVQTGPDKKFIYTIGADNKVSSAPITVRLIQDGVAVIDGVAAGTKIVVEGAQNLRPGSVVAEQGKGR
ncbi:MAG: efflux RND transporter periplasmic adaptor subunit [Gallionellaceae bacterium]|jgi:RND family efflux transporter MFP subunit|nr:efflux RND transporter periplasmic adaptor subunit [Gallionellaceae bacterium]